MTITWIKCSERMPPDDEKVIVKYNGIVSIEKPLILKACSYEHPELFSWITYDEVTWRKLNDV